MDKNEFGLLTPEEIDEVVAEVLEEAGITIKEMSKADADKLKAFQNMVYVLIKYQSLYSLQKIFDFYLYHFSINFY